MPSSRANPRNDLIGQPAKSQHATNQLIALRPAIRCRQLQHPSLRHRADTPNQQEPCIPPLRRISRPAARASPQVHINSLRRYHSPLQSSPSSSTSSPTSTRPQNPINPTTKCPQPPASPNNPSSLPLLPLTAAAPQPFFHASTHPAAPISSLAPHPQSSASSKSSAPQQPSPLSPAVDGSTHACRQPSHPSSTRVSKSSRPCTGVLERTI